jgi:L,D-peptidoglycan transpeptidase YkuD (ErfK/YbiS/YcfS/YnhG family)
VRGERLIVVVLLVLSLAGCGRPAERPAAPDPAPTGSGAAFLEPGIRISEPVSPPAPTVSPVRPSPSAPPSKAANLASRLRTVPKATSQLVVVHASAYSSTTATLETFTRKNGGWTAAFPPMAARIGQAGFSDTKREGDRATPTGMYAFDATMYGIAANPGVRFAYHRLVPDDYWNENSSSPGYNTFEHGPNPGGPSEALWTISPQYTHFAVVRYNMPATPGKGSGIFLHQANGNATLGCVSLPASDLVKVLTWLNPSAAPRIVLAPDAALSRF